MAAKAIAVSRMREFIEFFSVSGFVCCVHRTDTQHAWLASVDATGACSHIFLNLTNFM
jgi:hypothetical protein